MKIVYILNSFPNLSNTFVINEIVAMLRRDVDIEVFAFIKPKQKVVHPNVKLITKVNYFKSRQYIKIIIYHLYFLFTRPHRYIMAFMVSIVPKNGLLKLFLTGFPYVKQVLSRNPDILHAHFGTRPADFCMLVNLLTGIPYTFTTHGYDVHRAPAQNYKLKTDLSYRHITISNFNKHIMVNRFKVSENKLSVIRCGIDFEYPLPIPIYDKENIILSIARLEQIKGIDILIQACKLLSDNNIPFTCKIIGEGPEQNNLENLTKKLGLIKKIIFLGPRPHDEVFSIMSSAKMMVLPSRSESLSVALMEAMACGVPVIGPDIMGNPELIVNGESGFLVKPNDVDDLFNKIKLMLAADNLRNKFRKSAYEKVLQDFNLAKETEKLFNVWQECSIGDKLLVRNQSLMPADN